MLPIIPLTAVLAGLALAYGTKNQRRRKIRERPFPPAWVPHLERHIRLYRKLPKELKEELHGHIQVFLEEKMFEGCNGLEVTEEVKVTVAGLACMLLLNRKATYYPGLRSILLYPTAYLAETGAMEGGIHSEDLQGRAGESWVSGNVVLSWADVLDTAENDNGRNLVLHEFAHQLDQEDGRGDGVPILTDDAHYQSWADVLSGEYHELVERVERGQKTFLRAYGATNPAEFFAVTTEAFFEQPKEMHAQHPQLYEEFREYYQIDPESWG